MAAAKLGSRVAARWSRSPRPARVAATTTSSPASRTSSAGNVPAGLLGAGVGDGQHAQRRRARRAMTRAGPRAASPPGRAAGRTGRPADRRPGPWRRPPSRSAAAAKAGAASCETLRVNRIPNPRWTRTAKSGSNRRTTTRRSGRSGTRVERGRQVDQVVARGRDERPGACRGGARSRTSRWRASPMNDRDPGGPGRRHESAVVADLDGDDRDAARRDRRARRDSRSSPSPATMTWSWMPPGTVRRPSVWSSRERMSASVMNA